MAADTRIVDIEIPARTDFLAVVRLVVATALNAADEFERDRIDDVKLVLSEAATNAVEAHAATGVRAAVRVECRLSGGRLNLVVRDQGGGFHVAERPELPAVDDPARLEIERGLGIRLIESLADEVTYESDETGTIVRMVVLAHPDLEPDGTAHAGT